MKNTLVSYETLQASRSFNMRRFALAATLSITALSLAGCKSQQQVQKENAVDLEAQWKALDAQYSRECYDRLSAIPTGQSTKKALSGEWSKADSEAFDKAQAETQARIASAPCQSLAAKRKDIGDRMFAARRDAAK